LDPGCPGDGRKQHAEDRREQKRHAQAGAGRGRRSN
jgi:hypothetical protein